MTQFVKDLVRTQKREADQRRLCMAADIEQYGRLDTPGQGGVQADLVRGLTEAAELSGLDRLDWARQGQGDQEFAVLPPGTLEPVVLADFVRNLAAWLRQRNAGHAWEERMRLRLAIDAGVAHAAALGHSGPAPVAVARFLSAPELKSVLAALDAAPLAVIVSDRLYQDVVRSRTRGLDPDQYLRVHVSQKEFRGYGWLHVPGHVTRDLLTLLNGPSSVGNPPVLSPGPRDESQHVNEGVAFRGDVTGDVTFGYAPGRGSDLPAGSR
ncbi:hypothetical protein [Streptomyces sp. NPDC048636]|uniref:hypothetical protein n=1 Tax=Streptomyces sp. NPDC048636 TaxID=3155762 RepID=UPI0034426335